MKQVTNLIALLVVVLLSSFTIYQNMINYSIRDGFDLKIKGSSNVHDWESAVEDLQGTGTYTYAEDGMINIVKCNVSIPVSSIKSSKGSIMDKNTWRALKETSYPSISYNLTSFTNQSKSNTGFTAQTTGKLTIAGVTKTISMSVSWKESGNGNIEISGSKDLKMTTFGIDPPTALMGTMKTYDDITIDFNLVLEQQ